MRILGIDPGTARLGYGIIDEDEPPRPIEYGVVETPPGQPMPDRLLDLHREMRDLIRQYQPNVVAVEKLFFARNVTNAISVGQARGVVMLTAAQGGLEVIEYTPAEVKQAVAGSGNADKLQMQEMVRMLLDLDSLPEPDDAADALAVSLCHLQHARFQKAISESEAR